MGQDPFDQGKAKGRSDLFFDVTSRRQDTSSAYARKGILRIVVCIGFALSESPLVRAQVAVSTPLPEPKIEATPTPGAEKPSIEILAGTPSEKPAPIVKQTPPSKTEAVPIVALEKKPSPANRIMVRPKAPEPIPASVLTLSALKAMATSAPLPDYPYQAKQARVTGSGICDMVVDTTNGRVTSATMAQSTGSRILDKITTDTFGKWRFKPGTVAHVKVPITYE